MVKKLYFFFEEKYYWNEKDKTDSLFKGRLKMKDNDKIIIEKLMKIIKININ